MKQHFRILNVEDNEFDSELLEIDFKKAGLDIHLSRIDTLEQLNNTLKNENWDLIISDFSLPGFNGIKVVEILAESPKDIPVILMSGAVGEELAVEAMRKGARDFILKDQRARLIPALKRELNEREIRAQKKKTEQDLFDRQELLQLAHEGAQIGTWSLNPTTNHVTWSNSFKELLGYEVSDLKGTFDTYLSLIHEEDRKRFQTIIEASIHAKESFNIEHRIRSKDGNVQWFETRGNIFEDSSCARRLIAVSIDITKHINRENELKLAKEKAEESDQLKSSFLANMSHELRTPLNAIIGFSDIIQMDEANNPETCRFATIVKQNGNHLLKLINDIVDIAQLESKQLPLELVDFDLHHFLQEIKDGFSLEKKLEELDDFSISIPSPIEEPFIVHTDETRLRQVLINLINNAFKFTPSGHVHFGYKIINHNQLQFFVSDSGIGVPPNLHQIIFERFRQVDQSFTREFEGAGIGLSISKGLVQILGGSMGIESKVNEGSTFYFSLPCIKAGQNLPNIVQTMKQEKTDECNQLRLLVVEDTDTNYDLLAEILKRSNFQVTRAVNGQEAVQICEQDPHIDLVLMDLKMPEMDGFEATRLIKKRHPNLPVIAQTACVMPEEQKSALEAGCDGFIAKPIVSKDIISIVNSNTRLRDKHQST